MEKEKTINVGNTLFILGSGDPEMNLIEKMLARAGFLYCHALQGGKRVSPGQAYQANNILPIPAPGIDAGLRDWATTPGSLDGFYIVTVECGVRGLMSHYHIDHHRQGDRGFGKGPEEYFEGSSIGQLYDLLTEQYGVRAELYEDFFWEIRLAAAADHCLGHAYAGRCPNIHPGELALWRAITRAEFQMVRPREIIDRVIEAKKEILRLPEARLNSWPFRVAGRKKIRELPEASAQLGIPVEYEMDDRSGRVKVGIIGGRAELIRAWMDLNRSRLDGLYGDPERGYAGGYTDDELPPRDEVAIEPAGRTLNR